MKLLVFSLIFSWSLPAFASDKLANNEIEPEFQSKVYTPELVVDYRNSGPKGAVQLLWQKSSRPTRYEVEVSNGRLVYSQVDERHFHHVMLFYDHSYQWRVREVSASGTTQFTPWMPLKVVRGEDRHVANEDHETETSESPDADEFLLDTGG